MDTDQPPSTRSIPEYAAQAPWWQRLLLKLFPSLIPMPKTAAQLADITRAAHAAHIVDSDLQTMIDGAFSVADTRVRDIMVPRAQMTVLERDAPIDELLSTVLNSGHSRFPVMTDDREEAVGILLAKDLLRYVVENPGQAIDLREVCRGVKLVPESKRLNVLLAEFRAARTHLALVVDEYGGISGLVTIEDVLEQIVGNIDDEHDDEEAPNIIQHYNGRYTVNALTELDEFDAYFGTDFDQMPEAETVSGLLLQHFSRLPKRGETAEIGQLRFEILRADSRRLHQVAVALADESAVVEDHAAQAATEDHANTAVDKVSPAVESPKA